MVLEQIVKKNVPFAGEHQRHGALAQGRVQLPKPLTETLRERQCVLGNGRPIIFYRLHLHAHPKHIELTDYLDESAQSTLSDYTHAKVDEHGRFVIGVEELNRVGFTRSSTEAIPITYVGKRHKVFVYRTEDYESMPKRQREHAA